MGHLKYIYCNHRPPSQQHQPRLTMALGYIWNTKKHAEISSTPSLKHMFLEVSQSLWYILKQMLTPGREEKESQVTEVINFLGGYWHLRLAKLLPGSWFIKHWRHTETVGLNIAAPCAKGAELYSQRPRFYWSLWHLLRELVLCQHRLLENRKEITTDEKSKHFEHHWTLFRGKEIVISRLTGRNKVMHWSFHRCHSKILGISHIDNFF